MRNSKLAVAAAATLAALAGGALATAAWAAPRAPAGQLALHRAGSVKLGHLPTGLAPGEVTESPTGTVYFASGEKIYRVRGNHAPVVWLHVSSPVLAVAVSKSDLYYEIRMTVNEVPLAGGPIPVRHWHVPSPQAVTVAGLFIEGRTLWSWTDWETDSSGLELATVSRISISSAAVHKISAAALPGDFAADASGLYFIAARARTDVLAKVTPAGRLRTTSKPASGSVIGLWRHDVVTFANTSKPRVQRWNAGTLRSAGSARSSAPYSVADGSAGLVELSYPCRKVTCNTVGLLDPATGKVSQSFVIAGAEALVPGPRSAVIEVRKHGTCYLTWLAS
jgi:hypothetical protein